MATQFEKDCALMSGVADRATRPYTINRFPVPAGWIEDANAYKTAPSGFEATYFAKTNANGTKEIVIAFAPTNTKEMADIITDLESGLGIVTTQLLQAAEYYMKIRSENPDATITFTGHSLGGGFAALMGIFFNPAAAGRELILHSLLQYNNVHFIPRQLAARWLIEKAVVFDPAPFADTAKEHIKEAI